MDDPAPTSPPAAADSVRFGHFRVARRPDGSLEELGRGAMGVTYRATDDGLRIAVALKVIAADYVNDEQARRRFQREARAAAQLRHPNVASVLHLGEEGGEFFYAMEFVVGRPLSAILKETPIVPAGTALALIAQVAAALAAAHKREIIHRDLKPANLMLLEGEAIEHEDERTIAAGHRQIKVIDFGLARSFGQAHAEDSLASHTAAVAGGFTGTPAYASPEQCAGAKDMDGRSDLYSLGVILWQLLTGRLLFTGTFSQVIGKHQFQAPPFEQLADQPPGIVTLFRGLLAKEPEDRIPTRAGDLRDELDRLRRELSGSASPSPAESAPVAEPAPPIAAAPPALPVSATSRVGAPLPAPVEESSVTMDLPAGGRAASPPPIAPRATPPPVEPAPTGSKFPKSLSIPAPLEPAFRLSEWIARLKEIPRRGWIVLGALFLLWLIFSGRSDKNTSRETKRPAASQIIPTPVPPAVPEPPSATPPPTPPAEESPSPSRSGP